VEKDLKNKNQIAREAEKEIFKTIAQHLLADQMQVVW